MGLFVRPKVPKRGLFSCLWWLYEYRAVPLFDKKGDIIVRCYPCNGLGADVGGFAE